MKRRLQVATEDKSGKRLKTLSFCELLFAAAIAVRDACKAKELDQRRESESAFDRIADAIGPGVFTFGAFLGKNQFHKFPKLIDEEADDVNNANSPFYGLRNAVDEVEFISLFFYIVMVQLGSVHAKSLSRDSRRSIPVRSEMVAELMRRDDNETDWLTFKDFVTVALEGRVNAIAILFCGDDWMKTAFFKNQERARSPLLGHFHMSIICVGVMAANLSRIIAFMQEKDLLNQPFNVTAMEISQRTVNHMQKRAKVSDDVTFEELDKYIPRNLD